MPPLSPIQEDIVDRGSQIYKKDALVELYGVREAEKIWSKTTRDVFLVIGKGGGKDLVSQLTCLYIIHKLLCLKDPAGYYGKPSGDSIDIVNMAINAKQAKRVFFDGLVTRLKRTPWFDGRYTVRMDDVAFDENINLYSLHSSYEAAEGLNIIAYVGDEADGFEVEGQADAIYKALSGTVSSRFADVGKVICLSFPRKKDGFMMRKYNDAVLDKEVEQFSHTFKLNEDLEDGAEGNEFTVEWEEETVLGYKYSNFFALKAPTFRVNPIKSIEDYKMDFYSDKTDTLMRVCANPPDQSDETFFHNYEKVLDTFSVPNGWLDEEVKVSPQDDAEYYIHVDLSKVSDRTVVAMGHISDWLEPNAISRIHSDAQPFITIDLFRVWEPTKDNPVNDAEVMDFIMLLAKKFNVRLVTFDQWHSFDNIQYLESVGIDSKKNSLKREDYLEFRTALSEGRLVGPYDDRLHKELKNLIIDKRGKIDHPQGKGHHNDISEAVCGVIVNCIENTERERELSLVTLDSVRKEIEQEQQRVVIEKPEMPAYLSDFMQGWSEI